MIVAERHLEALTAAEIASIRAAIRRGRTVRVSLPRWGWLYLDRPLPFLIVHRSPEEQRTWGTELLTLSEASALVIPEEERGAFEPLLEMLVEELSGGGPLLLIEIRADEIRDVEKPGRPIPSPDIDLRSDPKHGGDLVDQIASRLRGMEVLGQSPQVRLGAFGTEENHPAGVTVVRLTLAPVWVNPETREPFPIVLRELRQELSRTLKWAAWRFSRESTTLEIAHYQELGRREVLEEDWQVDRELSRISARFQFLLDVTPVNPRSARREFEEGGWRKTPEFFYRRLSFDPEQAKGDLYRIPVDEVEDPTLHRLFREKRAEIGRMLTMLEQRETPDFLFSSLQQYGPVSDELFHLALSILDALPVSALPPPAAGSGVDAEAFAAIARQEIASYREEWPGLSSSVRILPEITSLMVSKGDLCVPVDLHIPQGRIQGLLHHEVGTHIVTWGNGRSQPLSQLHSGFAGYDELQEGLAVLAEYLVGELSMGRMRLLAGRVVAVRRLIEGATFPEIFHELRDHEFSPDQAFTITMRVCRGGGLTKDAVYLRGLHRLLAYVRGGGDLELLYIGKITENHVDLILELQRRRILQKPPLRPRYLDFPEAAERIDAIRDGGTVMDLIRKDG